MYDTDEPHDFHQTQKNFLLESLHVRDPSSLKHFRHSSETLILTERALPFSKPIRA